MAKHLTREMDTLKKELMDMAALVEDSLIKSIKALLERDAKLCKEVIVQDDEIDKKEVHVEEECLKALALYQPVAADLRNIVAFLKVNNDLERMGDLAVNIAQYAEELIKKPALQVRFDFSKQAKNVQTMVKKSLDALTNLDSALAKQILTLDDEIDEGHIEAFKAIQQAMSESPENIERGVYLLSFSKQLERIADLATNIAEDTIYMVQGDVVRHRVSQS